MKHLGGAKTKNGVLCNQINVDHFSDLFQVEQANFVNSAFLEPLEKYKLPAPLESLPTEDIPKILCVSEKRVKRTLLKVNPIKAATPDMIPNWLLKEYADILAFPTTEILNALYSHRRLPSVWKMPLSHPCRKRNSSKSKVTHANTNPVWPKRPKQLSMAAN